MSRLEGKMLTYHVACRVAMLALLVILLLEVSTGQGVLSHWPYNSFKLFQ